ncbi:MAG TPA: hypothetical protein VKB80_03835, partial [Kofleriaceae bacterium]|nr:hypothetical protein [Kofleriaceae bacterium]
HLAILLTGGIVRALLHRRAGGAMLYRHRGAFPALSAYLAAAFAHTGLCLALLYEDFSGATLQWSIAALVGTAWPICLIAAAARPGFRHALRRGPAATDDTAPDEVATLAVFLGLVGSMVALFAVYSSIERFGGPEHAAMGSTAVAVICGLFLVRAVVQLVAGFRGAGRGDDERRTRAVAVYVVVGLVASALAGAAIAMHLSGDVVSTREWYERYGTYRDWRFGYRVFNYYFSSTAVAEHLLLAYVIAVWPVLLHEFVRTRKTSTTAPPVEARRAGAALGALGWFLLATAALQIALALLSVIGGSNGMWMVKSWASQSSDVVDQLTGARSAWLQLLVSVPQLWVALELLGATPRRRAAATAYAACATIGIVASIWADLECLMRVISAGLGSTSMVIFFQVAFPLIVPIATLVFVQHNLRRGG